jgi:RimJ/RimL family protein N-acetyltransferase
MDKIREDFPAHQNRPKDSSNISEDSFNNDLGLPIGLKVNDWIPPKPVLNDPMVGTSCRVEPLSAEHNLDLWEAFSLDKDGKDWTFTLRGPYKNFATFDEEFKSLAGKLDPLFMAIIDLETGKAVGCAAFMNINPGYGSIELGCISFSRKMQRTTISTETIIIMMRHVFALGFRRLEWKTVSLNHASIAAAKRYGFSFEGIFHNQMVFKGFSRDIAWFSITDDEWPQLNVVYTKWLKLVENGQHQSLSTMVVEIKSS